MIKVKNILSLVVIVSLVLSNFAFAQYYDNSGPGSYEGRPIDPSKEGKEYYREDQVIVYPHKMGSEDERMMERFMKGSVSEDEMRRMAKSKFGERFDEMEFQKGMLESKERMSRKDAFSYEHEGYEPRYYAGPSYEGYSKEHILFGMVFQHIGDEIDPREIKQYCNEPEKIAEMVINKLKDKVGDVQNLCKSAEEQESKCDEFAKKGCSRIAMPYVRDDATEDEKMQSIAYSCPVNKDAIMKACILRSKSNIEQSIKHSTESCKKMFEYEGERLLRECERFKQNQVCEKEKYIERCMGGIKREDFDRKTGECSKWECEPAPGMPNYLCPDGKTWAGPGRCFRGQDGRCGWEIISCPTTTACPEVTIPTCAAGTTLQKKVDDKGCVSYYCQVSSTNTCPHIDPPHPDWCPAGWKAQTDANGCISYYCPTTQSPFVSIISPNGGESWEIGKTYNVRWSSESMVANTIINIVLLDEYSKTSSSIATDIPYEKGGYNWYIPNTLAKGRYRIQLICNVFNPPATYPGCSDQSDAPFSIVETTSPVVTCPKPTCEGVVDTGQKYSDGCIIYSCPTTQTTPTCPPEPQKPTCAEGQSLTTKHDEKGCVVGYECVTVTTTTTTEASITGRTVLNTYDDILRQCENSWTQQERACASMLESCDKDALIERCKQQSRRNYDEHASKIEQHCKLYMDSEIRAAEDRCSRIDKERTRCFEESTKRCEHMKGVAEKCRETLTEENIRKFIIEETKKRCKFKDIIQEEEDIRSSDKVEIVLAVLNTADEDDINKLELFVDGLKEDLRLQDTTVYKGMINPNNFGDIKLLPFVVNAKISAIPSSERAKEVKAKIVARQKVEEAASKLAGLRDSDVPSEYLYIIEDKASEVLDVSDKLEEIEKKEEEKGIGYKIKLFLGLAKAAEQEEIRQLVESKIKLSASIEALSKLIDEVPSDVAKSILKEQVNNLKQQEEDIEVLIETKEKKAKGLLGLFG